MTALVNRTPRFRGVFLRLRQGGRGVATSFVFLVLCLLAMHLLKPGGLTYFDVATIASSAAPLVLAALGQAVVVIGGGLDLSAGAVISLVNVVLVTVLGGSGLGLVAYTASAIALALALGAAMGMINGALVGYLGLQPVVVTLAVMFIVQGAALLLMPVPGGEFSEAASMVFVGDAIPGLLSAAVIVIVLAASAWLFFRNTRFGIALYAIGSDAEAAAVNGIDIRLVRFASYAVAGAFYGWAGLAISANTGSADPLIGAPMLLRVFAAVVLGGIVIGGGRGNAIGAVFGALILTIITSILLFSGIQTYYVPVVEGAVLLAAVLLFSVDRTSPAFTAWRRRPAPRRASAAGNAGSPFLSARRTAAVDWRRRVLPLLGFLAPAYVLFAATLIVTAILYGSGFSLFGYLVTLLVFTTFLAILGLGQGAVVISGGLDLSVAWSITLPAVILTVCANGSDTAAAYAIPLALLAGIVIGLVNGALVVGFRLSPIIVTLAIGGVLEGGTLIFSGGAPTGYAPPVLAAFVNGRWAGLPPIVWFLLLFAIAATLLLNCTVFGHRLAAVGKNAWIARLSGVEAGRVTLAAYVLSGFCSALVGVLLAGFNSQANYDMGKPYLLASIAVVVLGGTDIRGGRGHYLGILGGALLFTALGSMLSATALPEAVRGIVYGVVLLAAVLAMRKR